MNRAFFAPLGRQLARAVLGTFGMSGERLDDAFALLEAWTSLGGNVLDTAPVYGDGEAERVVGRFLEATRRRTEVVIITKCCHPIGDGAPRVTPSAIREDLDQSLSRLRTDSVDILMLHRDDPSVSVGPIIEALNEELAAGRILSAGASNWTTRRLQEANEFAARHGMAGFSSSSCQLSLAVQKEPMASGCISVHTPGDLAFHCRTKLPLFAWAALAGGFFRDGGAGDPDVERVYGSAENRERWARATRLSEARGVSVAQVALAWVLNQRFPAFAVFASQRLEHLRQIEQAAAIELSAREVAWLDLEAAAPDGMSTP
jgi:aryl-alcohol dehydrogenase-like predicted oxidoreductase